MPFPDGSCTKECLHAKYNVCMHMFSEESCAKDICRNFQKLFLLFLNSCEVQFVVRFFVLHSSRGVDITCLFRSFVQYFRKQFNQIVSVQLGPVPSGTCNSDHLESESRNHLNETYIYQHSIQYRRLCHFIYLQLFLV